MREATEFSLLLPVYAGDDAQHFTKAFASSVQEQTRPPNEIVVVEDGPIGNELSDAIDEATRGCGTPVQRIRLDENVGLARALEHGLARCSHDVVARMDADDISLPERFSEQLELIDEGFDLVGTGMYEFDTSGRILGKRIPPTDQTSIVASSRFRDPFNHPTVVYRRSAVRKAGGYRDLSLMEDYWLFARMIHSGAAVTNIAHPLVMYRVDAGSYQRRGGWRLFRSEMRLQSRFLRERFVTVPQFVRNVVVRGAYRFVPVGARRFVYRRFMVRGTDDIVTDERQ